MGNFIEANAELPASFQQSRILDQNRRGPKPYMAWSTNAPRAGITDALRLMQERHPLLRTIYRRDQNGDWLQRTLNRNVPIKLSAISVEHESTAAALACHACQRIILEHVALKIDISAQTPWNLLLAKTESDTLCMVAIDHVAVDASSVHLLAGSIETMVQGAGADRETSERYSYADFARAQTSPAYAEGIQRDLEYWSTQRPQLQHVVDTLAPRRSQTNASWTEANVILGTPSKLNPTLLAQTFGVSPLSVVTAIASAAIARMMGLVAPVPLLAAAEARYAVGSETTVGPFANAVPLAVSSSTNAVELARQVLVGTSHLRPRASDIAHSIGWRPTLQPIMVAVSTEIRRNSSPGKKYWMRRVPLDVRPQGRYPISIVGTVGDEGTLSGSIVVRTDIAEESSRHDFARALEEAYQRCYQEIAIDAGAE